MMINHKLSHEVSFNFFRDVEKAIQEFARISKVQAIFFGNVPIPERKSGNAGIAGKIYSEEQLKKLFGKSDWKFIILSARNGVLLYFKAEKYKIIPSIK